MDLLDSLKWSIGSQNAYRLAVFRRSKDGSKVITDNRETIFTVLFVLVAVTEGAYIGYKVYFNPAVNFFKTEKTAKGFQLFTLIGYLEFTLTILNAMFFVFTAFFKRRGQIKFIEKMQKIDDTLKSNFNIKIDYSEYKFMSVIVLISVLLYYNVMVSCVMYFFLVDIQSISAIFTFIIYIVQSSSSGIFTYGFVGYVILIETRVAIINEQLSEIVRFPPEILEKQYKTKEALCDEMMRYTKMYKSLCSCVEDLNQIYGSSMVLHFAHDFTLLTTQIFAMFYIGFFEDLEKSLFQILALMVWLLPNIIKMTFICFTCHMTRNEMLLKLRPIFGLAKLMLGFEYMTFGKVFLPNYFVWDGHTRSYLNMSEIQ